MVLQAAARSAPQAVLEEGKAALKLFLTAHAGAGSPAFQSFLSVNVVSVPGRRGSVPERHVGSPQCSETQPDCRRRRGLTEPSPAGRWRSRAALAAAAASSRARGARRRAGFIAPRSPGLSVRSLSSCPPFPLAGDVCGTPAQGRRHKDDDLCGGDRVMNPAARRVPEGAASQS